MTNFLYNTINTEYENHKSKMLESTSTAILNWLDATSLPTTADARTLLASLEASYESMDNSQREAIEEIIFYLTKNIDQADIEDVQSGSSITNIDASIISGLEPVCTGGNLDASHISGSLHTSQFSTEMIDAITGATGQDGQDGQDGASGTIITYSSPDCYATIGGIEYFWPCSVND